jgi:murein DD-endopeptidase MepM/ murein hydrolase activator NlpD
MSTHHGPKKAPYKRPWQDTLIFETWPKVIAILVPSVALVVLCVIFRDDHTHGLAPFVFHPQPNLHEGLAEERAWPKFESTGGSDSVPLEEPEISKPARPRPPRGPVPAPSTEAQDIPAVALRAPHTCPLRGAACRGPQRPSQQIGADRPGRTLPNGKWLDSHEHRGIDIGKRGDQVQAVWACVVDHISMDRDGSSGLMVELRCLFNGGVELYPKYMHLDSIAPGLVPGVYVHVGQDIGIVGSTGVSRSAAHLHFEIRDQPRGGDFFDPNPLITP